MWFRTYSRIDPDAPVLPNGDAHLLEVPIAAIPDTDTAPPVSAPMGPGIAVSPSLSPARLALADAIAAHRAALALLEAAQTPLRRLQEPIDEFARVDGRLAEIDRANDADVGRWIAAGSQGGRPMPPAEVVGLRQLRDTLLPDATAARLALPAAQAEFQRVAQAAIAAARQKDEALVIAAANAARDVIEAELVPAVTRVVEIEARVAGLAAVLREAGDRGTNPMPGAIGGSLQIVDMVREAKHRPAVPIAIDQAWQFLNALAVNAEAVLP